MDEEQGDVHVDVDGAVDGVVDRLGVLLAAPVVEANVEAEEHGADYRDPNAAAADEHGDKRDDKHADETGEEQAANLSEEVGEGQARDDHDARDEQRVHEGVHHDVGVDATHHGNDAGNLQAQRDDDHVVARKADKRVVRLVGNQKASDAAHQVENRESDGVHAHREVAHGGAHDGVDAQAPQHGEAKNHVVGAVGDDLAVRIGDRALLQTLLMAVAQ